MITSSAVITAKPGKCEAILQRLRANVPAVQAEKGCLRVRRRRRRRERVAVPDPLGPGHLPRHREVDGMEALKAHAAAPHMAAYGAKTREMIASRVIHILSPA